MVVTARRWLGVGLAAVAVLAIVAVVVLLAVRGADGVRRLEAGDDGGVVELHRGQQAALTLQGNPTTGYAWEVVEIDEGVLSPAGSPDYQSDSSAIGAGGAYTFRFDAIGPGETAVRLVYQRPGEQAEPAGTFTFTAVVQ
jgi:predicted secreted protein